MKSVMLICVLLLGACGGGSGSGPTTTPPETQSPDMPVANTPTSVPETSLYEEKTITQTIDGSLVERTYRLRYPENLTEEQYPSLFFSTVPAAMARIG